jgi:hypothetical protein
MEMAPMGSSSDTVAKLENVYRQWHVSTGGYDTAALIAGATP